MCKPVVLSAAFLVALLGAPPAEGRGEGAERPAAGTFEISLPAGSMVTSHSPSHLVFTVKNTGASGGLSGLCLRFPPGYEVSEVSPPAGWIAERSAGGATRQACEISFRTGDDGKCAGAIAPGRSLTFGVTVFAAASRVVAPGRLVSARARQNCGGDFLESRTALPSWDRREIEVLLTASPSNLRRGEAAIVSMTVNNLSSVNLKDLSAFLHLTGTAGVDRIEGPTPEELRLAPGATGTLTWTARATSAGTLSFSGQAVARGLIAPPVESNTLLVDHPDLPPDHPDAQGAGGQDPGMALTALTSRPVLAAGGTSAPAANPTSGPGAQANPQPLSAAGIGTRSHVPPATPEQEAVRVHLLSFLHDGTRRSDGRDFSATSLRDLLIVAEYQNLSSGSRTQRLKLFAPDGALYQQFTQEFRVAARGNRPPGQARVPGRLEVEARLPVGGTWITEHGLYGTWRLELYLDSAQTPLLTEDFVLTE